ncbi:MAG: hypothetical protein K4H23_04700 [Mollicutes bacterium PWAP]|nr:hypothetical protein [Mollicutes bacterium PWAP]
MNKFFKYLRSELKSKLTWGQIALVIGLSLLPLLTLIISIAVESPHEKYMDNTHSVSEGKWIWKYMTENLESSLVMGLIYAIIFRLVLVFKEKSKLDRNRVSYLHYRKQTILSIRMFVDAILFLLQILFTIFIALIIIVSLGGKAEGELVLRYIMYAFSATMFFVMVSYVCRSIQASGLKKWVKGIIITIWLIITVGYIIIMSFVLHLENHVNSFYSEHQYIVSFVPLLNNLTATGIISFNHDKNYVSDIWAPIFMMVSSILVIAGTFNISSRVQKNYLTN